MDVRADKRYIVFAIALLVIGILAFLATFFAGFMEQIMDQSINCWSGDVSMDGRILCRYTDLEGFRVQMRDLQYLIFRIVIPLNIALFVINLISFIGFKRRGLRGKGVVLASLIVSILSVLMILGLSLGAP